MKKTRLTILIAVVVILAGVVIGTQTGLFSSSGEDPPPAELAEQALTATQSADREVAAGKLIRGSYQEALPAIRRVMAETEDPKVKAVVIRGLQRFYDHDSLPMMIDAMESDSLHVRAAAEHAVPPLLGIDLFDADADPGTRAQQVAAVRRQWEWVRNNPWLDAKRAAVRQHFEEGGQ